MLTAEEKLQRSKSRNAWVVCFKCGAKYGRVSTGKATLSQTHSVRRGRCEICGRSKRITDFRDFGYSKH